MCEIIEYKEEELLGFEIYRFMNEESRNKAKEQIERRKQGISEIHDSILITKSGKSVWVNIATNPVLDETGVYRGALAMMTDITERKKGEEALIKRDNQIIIAAQMARLGYWEYDIRNDTFTFNDQFYEIFKTTAEKMGGYTMTAARYAELFVHPEDQEIVNKSVGDAINSSDPEFTFKTEHRIVYATGEIGYISVHFRIVKDDYGRTIKNFGVNQDITERKKVELEKLTLIDGLQAKNKDLQQFSYIVSHNLRAPIAKIMGLASIMETESEENKLILKKLNEETAHLDDVVKDINTIVSARKSPTEKMEVVSFDTELRLIMSVLEADITQSNAIIASDFSQAKGISTIKSYLYSILYNLISNAIKYRQPDVPLRIAVKSTYDEKFICLSVKDNGRGIDLKKNATKIFGLYKRFHGDLIPGKGIGLNLVKTHAETLGGRVDIESEINKGTTFSVYIPNYNGKIKAG
jgi:PAS domain S-box-containing protein